MEQNIKLNNPLLLVTTNQVKAIKGIKTLYNIYSEYHKTFGRGLELLPIKDIVKLFILSEYANIKPVSENIAYFNKIVINKQPYSIGTITQRFKKFFIEYIEVKTVLDSFNKPKD